MAGRGPSGSGAHPASRPEPLVGLNGQVVVRVVADDARAGEVGPGGRGLVVLVRGPAIQPADEKGRTLLGSRTALDCPLRSGGFAKEPEHLRRAGWRRGKSGGGSPPSSRRRRSSGCWTAARGWARSRPSWG